MKPIWTKSISSLGLGLTLTLACLWLVGWQLVSSASSPVVSVYAAEPSIPPIDGDSISPAGSSAGLLEPSATITTCVNNVWGSASYITTSTTWASGNAYLADNCSIVVNAGVTLTIEGGVTVMFTGTSSALIVNGTLLAESADASQPITFTSLAAAKSPGQWFGLHFAAGSKGRLNNVFIGYAGSGDLNGYGAGWNVAQVHVVSADVQMRNSLVTAGKMTGIYFEGAGLSPLLDTVQVSNNASGNPANPAYAIYQATVNMTPTFRSLVLTGNDSNAVTMSWGNEAITQNVTMGGSGAPYRFDRRWAFLQVIPAGMTVTINPGTELQYDAPDFRILVQSGGTLLAEGTAAQPITFTSGMTTRKAGDWQGIRVDANGSAHLAYVDLGYAGGEFNNTAALESFASDVQVRHARFHDNGWDGVRINGTNVAPVFEDVSVLNSGGYGVHMGDEYGPLAKPTWDGGAISGNGNTGIYLGFFGYGASAVLQPTFRNLTIANNQGDGVFIDWNGPVPTFENVAITGNTGAAMTQSPDSSPVYRNLTLSGNGTDAVVIRGGSIGGGRYWGAGQPELPFQVQGHVTIPSGAFLSLEPGMTLRFITDTSLLVSGSGALYALGTPDRPITFTGLVETPGFWRGIEIDNPGQAILQNCDIGYAGHINNAMGWNLSISSSGLNVVQNCRIHHSLHAGIYAGFYTNVGTPILSHNQIYSNTDFGVVKEWDPDNVDARNNWWGDPSGPYHPTLNPGGKGDAINDARVLFDPWLTAPPTQTTSIGQFVVDTGGPRFVSPGQTVDYAIQYMNLMTETVADTVLVLQLPVAADYVDSTGGGIHWPERNQVFWKLGAVHPGDNDLVSVRVRFRWGLPSGYNDGTITLLAGSNFQQNELDVAEYNAYQPLLQSGQTAVSQAEFDVMRLTYPDLQTLYAQAVADGYIYLEAARLTYSNGAVITEAVMRRNNRQFTRVLVQQGNESTAITVGSDLFAMNDTTGGMTMTLSTTQRQFWGDWAASASQTAGAAGAASSQPAACTEAKCKINCIGKKVTFSTVIGRVGAVVAWTLFLGPGGVIPAVYGVGKVVVDISQCDLECTADPNSNCCAGDMVRWSVSSFVLVPSCLKEYCNATTGTYGTAGTVQCTASGQRCVAGYNEKGGCKDCKETSSALYTPVSVVAPCAVDASGLPRCTDLALRRAGDPNALYGPTGDLTPGQQVTYTITYENKGEGYAYGVYVRNPLGDYFDPNTVTMYTTTTASSFYLTASHELVWLVGELGPKGTISSTGAMTYSVRLKTGLPSGTVIRNQAIVYFPSVPEETPTNPVVNVIQPLVAIPQQVSTSFHAPVIITLQGRDVSGLPLTYSIVTSPTAGTLTGVPPVMTYSPADNFIGGDFFAFKAGNGVAESRPADVLIQVNPSAADTEPPQVLWTEPVSGALAVAVQAFPVYTDTVGPAYAPFAFIGFTKVISASTVSAQTVQLIDGAGQTISSSVSYDAMLYQVVVVPRQPLQARTAYTVTVTTGVRDMTGNPLAAGYHWSFLTAGAPPRKYIYLPLVMRNH